MGLRWCACMRFGLDGPTMVRVCMKFGLYGPMMVRLYEVVSVWAYNGVGLYEAWPVWAYMGPYTCLRWCDCMGLGRRVRSRGGGSRPRFPCGPCLHRPEHPA